MNINKIAVVRNSRGGNLPDVVRAALDCERFGAQGITVHPRPDARHIRYSDVRDLKKVLTTEFNIEGNPIPSFRELVLEVRPAQVTLVPDAHDVITSNAGWDTKNNFDFLSKVVDLCKSANIRTSIFVEPDLEIVEYAAKTGADRIELYTEPYAVRYPQDKEDAIKPFVEAAEHARGLGLGVNAGHDLSLENLRFLHERIPFLSEVSIGHCLICDALYLGLRETIKQYKECLK